MTLSLTPGELRELRDRFTVLWRALQVGELLMGDARVQERTLPRGELRHINGGVHPLEQPRPQPSRRFQIVRGGRAVAVERQLADAPRRVPPRVAPAEPAPIGRARRPQSKDVGEALALLRRAVADCGYTLDALAASIASDRTDVDRVLEGEAPRLR